MITIEFSGWLEVEASKIRFYSCDNENEHTISGEEWLKLSSSERGSYIIESLSDAMDNSDVLEYVDLDVFESKEE